MKLNIKSAIFAAALLIASLLVAGAANAESRHFQAFDAIKWEAGPKGLHFGLLWGDWNKGPYGMIVRIEAGHVAPLHSHTADYHGVSIQGNWIHTSPDGTEHVVTPGSYAFQAGGKNHGDRCRGPEDCFILINMQGPRDFIPAK